MKGCQMLGGIHKLRLQDLSFFDHLSPSAYIFYGIKVLKKSIFLTTYPPPLVNVQGHPGQSVLTSNHYLDKIWWIQNIVMAFSMFPTL